MTEDYDLPFPQYRCPTCERDLPLNEARMTVTCAEHQPGDDLVFSVCEAHDRDKRDIEEICDRAFGETEIDVFETTFDVMSGVNLIAKANDRLAGLMSVAMKRGELLIVLLSVYPEYQGRGVGAALVRAAIQMAKERGVPSLRCAVSNDDIALLYFYQRHGFVIEDIAVGLLADIAGSAVAGFSGIPLRDEIRLRRSVCQ